MGGICGIITFDGADVPSSQIQRMIAVTPHRGADVRWTGTGAALVRQEQSTDRPRGQGPARVGDVVVLADARLDNRDELVASFRTAGWLRGDTGPDDATLIGVGYQHWGAACADRLVGDFAFVVWDDARRVVIGARDPMAMRPLYYRFDPARRFVFATEAKQILALPDTPVTVNEQAVAAFLVAAFDRSDTTYWEGIAQIAPGHVVECDGDRQRARRYWDIDPGSRLFHRDTRACADHLRQVFVDAVTARMQAPTMGVLLSGGMDSGSAAATAGMLLERDQAKASSLRAYSWAFDELRECDERHVSSLIVQRYPISQVDVPADNAGPLAGYPAHDVDVDDPIVGAFQPLIEQSLAIAARDGVDVMLGGDRGDLLIGDTGVSYLRMAQARRWRSLRDELSEHRRSLDDTAAMMLRRHLIDAISGRARRRSALGWLAWSGRKLRRRTGADDQRSALPPWVRPDFAQRVALHEINASQDAPEGLGFARSERYRWIFAALHMRGMVWSERTYARYGVGFADPFSDRRLVELVMALPQAVINRPGDQSKPLLRQAMHGIMPDSARAVADKILPTPLYWRGLRCSEPVIRRLLTDARAAQHGWLDSEALLGHYEASLAGHPLDPEFWYALSIERWLRVAEGGTV